MEQLTIKKLRNTCKVCGKQLVSNKPIGNEVCPEHQYTEGNVWVLTKNYRWKRKFPKVK